MSLLRLLSAGKSLVGLKQAESRYHLPGQRSLPQFGAKKNPFRKTVFPDRVEPVPSACDLSEGSPQPGAPAESAPAVGESGACESAVCPPAPPSGSVPLEQAGPAQSPARRTGLKAWLLWGRARTPKASRALPSRPLIQGELSLDSVKVVRNDLAESDLEVVPARPSTLIPPVTKSQPAESTSQRASSFGSRGAVNELVGAAKM